MLSEKRRQILGCFIGRPDDRNRRASGVCQKRRGRRSILNTPSVALVEPGEQGFTPLPEDGGQLAVLFIPAQPGALRYLLRSHACIRQAVRVENAFQESRLSFRRLGR